MNITVIIPPQMYNVAKYIGQTGRCYLEEALDKIGIERADVYAFGFTTIQGIDYEPLEPFSADIVRIAFENDEAVVVTLIPQS